MKKVVPAGAEQLVSYDYTDIANGTGIQTFYPTRVSINGTNYYSLSPSVIYSDVIYTQSSLITQSGVEVYNKMLDLDFDIPINLPKTIKGSVLINVPFALENTNTNTESRGFINAILRKWDGTTETTLASSSGSVLVNPLVGTAPVYYDTVSAIRLDVNSTNIKAGETIRLTLEGWASVTAGKTSYIDIAHDPKNRTVAAIFEDQGVTQSAAYIPFKLNV
jgi:hypothetical protein